MTGPGPKRFYQPITMQLSKTHSISAHAFLIIDSQSNSQQYIYFPIKLEHLGETLETHLPLLLAWPPPLPLKSKAPLLPLRSMTLFPFHFPPAASFLHGVPSTSTTDEQIQRKGRPDPAKGSVDRAPKRCWDFIARQPSARKMRRWRCYPVRCRRRPQHDYEVGAQWRQYM
jgi:hypothetical protein